jgi:hypothetical protein
MTTPPHYSLEGDIKEAFRESAIAYYGTVDWAVDITEAQFSDVDLYMVPGELIRRDSETRFLLRRSSFDSVARGDLNPDVRIYVDRFESTSFESIVAIAPT